MNLLCAELMYSVIHVPVYALRNNYAVMQTFTDTSEFNN